MIVKDEKSYFFSNWYLEEMFKRVINNFYIIILVAFRALSIYYIFTFLY